MPFYLRETIPDASSFGNILALVCFSQDGFGLVSSQDSRCYPTVIFVDVDVGPLWGEIQLPGRWLSWSGSGRETCRLVKRPTVKAVHDRYMEHGCEAHLNRLLGVSDIAASGPVGRDV